MKVGQQEAPEEPRQKILWEPTVSPERAALYTVPSMSTQLSNTGDSVGPHT